MIKNIPAHKFFASCFFLVTFCDVKPMTFMVNNFSDETVAQLRIYETQYPDGFTVQVKPHQSIMGTVMGWSEWITGNVPTNASSSNWPSLKPLIQYTFGGTVVSYCATIYIIYRAYYLLKKIGTWTHWLGKEHDEEIILYVRKKEEEEHALLCLSSIKNEITVLERYIFVHKKLQALHLRWLFPQNKAYDACIVERLDRLKALERKLPLNKK